MAMLAMDWAEDDTTAEPAPKRVKSNSDAESIPRDFYSDSKSTLKNFVFLIQLSKVDSNISLEEVIIQQHSRLKSKNIQRDQIATVLQRKKVLLLFDGYDEYKKETTQPWMTPSQTLLVTALLSLPPDQETTWRSLMLTSWMAR